MGRGGVPEMLQSSKQGAMLWKGMVCLRCFPGLPDTGPLLEMRSSGRTETTAGKALCSAGQGEAQLFLCLTWREIR